LMNAKLHQARHLTVVFSIAILIFMIYLEFEQEGVNAFAAHYIQGEHVGWDYSFHRWFFYYSPYVRIFEFILGCLVGQLFLASQHHPPGVSEKRRAQASLIGALIVLGTISIIHVLHIPGGVLNRYINFLVLNFGLAVPLAIIIFVVSRHSTFLSPWL